MVMSFFLAAAAVKAVKKPYEGYRRQRLWCKAEKIRVIKAHETDSLLEVSSQFFGSSYFFVVVVDQAENVLHILTEKDIFEFLLRDSTLLLKDVSSEASGKILQR